MKTTTMFAATAALAALLFAAPSALAAGPAADSAPMRLDLRESPRLAADGETFALAYSPRWGGAANCSITADGSRLLSNATDEGTLSWTARGVGRHALSFTAGALVYDAAFTVLGDDAVAIDGGRLQSSATWAAGKTWVVTAPLTVSGGVTLTIEPGAVVKFMPGASLTVESGGACVARGVVFTHIADDTAGGDTMMDGDGGDGSPGTARPTMGAYTITGVVTDDDATEYRYMPPQTLTSSISSDTRLRGHRCYIVSNSVTVASGATLTLQPGTVIKFNTGCQMTVNGTLSAQGTRAAPIVFTSLKDDAHGGDTNGDGDKTYAQPGDWHQITGSGTVTMDHCQVLWCSAQNNQGALYPRGGTWTFDNSIVAHCEYDCMRSYGGTFTARNSTFMDSSMGAAPSSGTARFDNCVFYDLTTAVRWGNGTFNNCIFAKITQDIIDTKFYSSTLSSKFSHCCFWNPESTGDHAAAKVGQNGNIYADPLFLDPENGDFRIAANSPCVDAADSAAAPELDFYGQPRTTVRPAPSGTSDALGRNADIGIHEFYPSNVPGIYDLSAKEVSTTAKSAAPGESIAVTWTVGNAGKRAVPDPWHDALYLVSDSGKAYALGEPLNPGALAAGASRETTATFPVPVVPAGSYRLRLAVNSRRSEVPEGSSTGNNAALSETSVAIAIPATAASAGASGSVAPGAAKVVAFDIPSGSGDLLLRLTAPAGGSGLSARVGLGFQPTDSGSGTALTFANGESWLMVPAGTERVYLVVENGSASEASFAADFRAGSLSLASVSPSSLPASGAVTLQIAGAGFGDGCAVLFGGSSAAVKAVRCVSSSLLAATIDCAKLSAGSRLALSVAKGAETKTLENAVAVSTAAGAGKFWAKLNVPDSVREGRLVQECFVEYGNDGTADVPSPVVQVVMEGNGTLGYVGGLSGQKKLQFVAAGGEGSAGVLRPGETHRIRFALRAGSSNGISLRSSVGSDYAPAPWTSAAAYHADLSAAATRIGLRGQDATDYALVFDLAKAMKNGEPTSAIFGRVIDEDGAGVEGVLVTFTDAVAGNAVDALTDANGLFCTTNVAAGTFSATIFQIEAGEVAADGDADCAFGDLRIAISVNFAVLVSDANGDVSVTATDLKSGAMFGAVASGGRAEFCGLSDGIYMVEGFDTNGARRAGAAVVLGGRADDVSLSFRDGTGTVRISVSELANPVGCSAIFFRDGVIECAENLDENGELLLTGCVAGDYLVVVGREGADDLICANFILAEGETAEIPLAATGSLAALSSASPKFSLAARRSGISFYPTSSVEENCEILLNEAKAVISTQVLPPLGIYDCEHNRAEYEKTKATFEPHVLNYLRFFAALSQYRAAKYKKWASVWKLPIISANLLATEYFGPLGGGAISIGNELITKALNGEDLDEGYISDTADLIVGIAGKNAGVWGNRVSALGKLKTIVSVVTGLLDVDRNLRSQFAKEEWLAGEYQKFQKEMFVFEFQVTHAPFYEGINGNYSHLCNEYVIEETLPTIEAIRPSVPQSCDPNEMAGPAGAGADRALLPGETYEWTIYFENLTNATAAAAEVRVTAQLSDQLDWTTFETVAVTFGDQTDAGLEGKANGTSEYAVPGTNYSVRSEVAFDAETGSVSWYLRIVDPDGDEDGWPLDPYAGFLPPNDPETHCGEGHITYRVKVRDDAETGARIDASATIVFDYNDPIETDPAWWNTVGAVAEAMPVYRFYSKNYKGHFFTIDEGEMWTIRNTNRNWSFEGTAYMAFTNQVNGTVPLYRFYSKGYRGHFFTIDADEAEVVKKNRNWEYEGVAYYVYPQEVDGSVPVFRFWSDRYRHHFYTINEEEKDSLIATNPNWAYEGVAFYALSAETVESGVKSLNKSVSSAAVAVAGEETQTGGRIPGNGSSVAAESEASLRTTARVNALAASSGESGDEWCSDAAPWSLWTRDGTPIACDESTELDAVVVESRLDAPDAEELQSAESAEGDALLAETPPVELSLRLSGAPATRNATLWSATDGTVSEESFDGTLDFDLPATGVWHWLRAADDSGNDSVSVWLRATAD